MKLAKSALFFAVSLALAAGSAFAADKPKKDNDPGFSALDKNNDGSISRVEAAANPELAKQFKAADKNNDGKLSRTEYLTVMTKKDFNTAKEKVSNVIKKEKEPGASAGSSK